MKKLAVLMAVVLLAVAALTFSVSAFEDVTINDDCFAAVNTLTALDVIKGKTETSFGPDDAITREQMAALFTRLYTTVAAEGGENFTPFTDLSDPYYNYVISWCYDAGVINGTSATTFEPKGNIIYQDALTMATRLLGYTDLTYPLGYITKARLIGLTDGLEGVAYDKDLTRGEVAIILYNALEAEGKEVIRENKVKFYNDYPILESVERNFEIALDVYNFKKETYQIVGTEDFYLEGYDKATTAESFMLALVDTDNDRVSSEAVEMDYEDILVDEDVDNDDYILSYIEILYRGDSISDKKAVILSSVFASNLDADADVSVYYKKNSNGKLVAQTDRVTINGKNYKVEDKMYIVDSDGEIKAATANSLDREFPVFFQADNNDEGKYAQKAYDVNNDGEVDYVIVLPMSLQKVNNVTSKGVYTLKNLSVTPNATTSYDTQAEDPTNPLILDVKVAKNDYVLTYTYGPYTIVAEKLEPVVTTVRRATGATGARKYTLATGDVVSFSKKDSPLIGCDNSTSNLAVSNDEVALYIVNDKVVYSDNADALGYAPYSYAFVVRKGDDEISVDTEDGKIENVSNLIAYINGKAVTIPTDKDYSKDTNWNSILENLVTIKSIKDGKYVLEAGAQVKDAYNAAANEGYEIKLENQNLSYNRYSNVYKIGNYTVTLDANSEFYVKTLKDNKYDSVKRYTMANTPTTSLGNVNLQQCIIRVNYGANGKPSSYTLVVAIAQDNDGTFATSTDYRNYRIVLEAGLTVDKGNTYAAYELLNPVTGAIESVVDNSAEVDSVRDDLIGAIVVQKANGAVTVQSSADAANTISNVTNHIALTQVVEDGILNDNLVTFYKGKEAESVFTGTNNAELVLNGINVVVIDIDDETGEYVIDVTDDYSELSGKVVRMYTNSDLSYRAYYIVVVPYEWAEAAGFTQLSNYAEAE